MNTLNTAKLPFHILISTMLIVSGCAQKSADISASYVSPLQYQSYSCSQISAEAQRLSGRASEVTGVQNKKATNDAVATGVALVLFWPAVFLIGGDKENGAELARLKGEMEALEKASIQKNCGIRFKTVTSADAA
ncbi:hypothetical protein [Litoreibacter halocynthiae]|uniref:hypothetical protein n=1 Tax=Litoreibacter halocynthiae TaxID=1242689 RepID=UPI0024920854|nr:hypothetical protein [Litoreibacter halocynthiae]